MRTARCAPDRHSDPRVNYTEALTALARDITVRVPDLSFIDMDRILIFARVGRGHAEGATASCHCLCLPEDAPGYYFWRDERGVVTRRTEWFVARTPVVQRTGTRLDYLISVALPRFCDQRINRGRKAALYPSADEYVAKLDTLVHELYHVDPLRQGIRTVAGEADGAGGRQHGPAFYADVARFVNTYLESKPDPAVYEFLRYDFAGLQERYGTVVATTFRNFPSYPQIYLERVAEQPDVPNVREVVPVKAPSQPTRYADADIVAREFWARGSERRARARIAEPPVPRPATEAVLLGGMETSPVVAEPLSA